MKLFASNIEALSRNQPQTVSSRAIAEIQKKTRYHKNRFSFIILTLILTFVCVYSLFHNTGLLPVCCILLVLILPVTFVVLRRKHNPACYAAVTEKETRYAPKQPRFSPSFVPYEQTESAETFRQKQTLFYPVYYCSVEINGQQYDHVCCFANDYDHIKIGDHVIVSAVSDTDEAVVFAMDDLKRRKLP